MRTKMLLAACAALALAGVAACGGSEKTVDMAEDQSERPPKPEPPAPPEPDPTPTPGPPDTGDPPPNTAPPVAPAK